MLYITLSSDLISLVHSRGIVSVSTQDIEKNLPKILVDLLRETVEKDIFVLNGPGSFTTLRLGCLILNEINMMFDKTLRFWTCTKIALYRFAYRSSFLPRYWYIYIWQKNNVRKIDLAHWTETKIACGETMTHDLMQGEIWWAEWDEAVYFVDSVTSHRMLDYLNHGYRVVHSFIDNRLCLTYRWHTISFAPQDLCSAPLSSISPEYLIEPSLG